MQITSGYTFKLFSSLKWCEIKCAYGTGGVSKKRFNPESSIRRNILFTGTVKVKHKLPYYTFIHRVKKSYTKPRIFENMGFDMKYDLTYNNFLGKKVSVW